MRLRSRTGTALTLACLLATSALAQAPHTESNPPPSHDADVAPLPDTYSYDDYEDYSSDYDDDGGVVTDLDALDAAHEAYLKKKDLQLERPEYDAPEAPPPKPPPSWLRAIFAFLDTLAPVFQILFYGFAAAVVLGFLYFMFGEALRVRFGKPKLGDDGPGDDVLADVRPDAATARSLLEEADALARAGKFAEAVHLLLFRSIEDIQTRLEGGVPKSLTAREIGGLGRLPTRAKQGLRPIIEIVERSFFGGRDVDADGWQQARASYEDFAFGEGWS